MSSDWVVVKPGCEYLQRGWLRAYAFEIGMCIIAYAPDNQNGPIDLRTLTEPSNMTEAKQLGETVLEAMTKELRAAYEGVQPSLKAQIVVPTARLPSIVRRGAMWLDVYEAPGNKFQIAWFDDEDVGHILGAATHKSLAGLAARFTKAIHAFVQGYQKNQDSTDAAAEVEYVAVELSALELFRENDDCVRESCTGWVWHSKKKVTSAYRMLVANAEARIQAALKAEIDVEIAQRNHLASKG